MLTKRYNNPTIPFMAAGLTDHVWPMEDLLTFKPVNYCRLNGPRPEFELGRKFSSSEDIIHHFKGFLLNAYASNTKVLIIIDKAQRLHSELREEIRHLSAIKMAGRRFLKIFIVSQTEFNDILKGEENADVREKIVAGYHIEPLKPDETHQYISHRIQVPGSANSIFNDQAIKRINTLSQGFLWLINIICDHALLSGYVKGINQIDLNVITNCEKRDELPRSAS